MTPEQRRARGIAAKALINDETIRDGWALLESELIEEWSKPAAYDDERAKAKREGLWVELQILRRLRQKLATFAGQAPRD